MQTLTIDNICRKMQFARTCVMISCLSFIRQNFRGTLHFSHIPYYITTYLNKDTLQRKWSIEDTLLVRTSIQGVLINRQVVSGSAVQAPITIYKLFSQAYKVYYL